MQGSAVIKPVHTSSRNEGGGEEWNRQGGPACQEPGAREQQRQRAGIPGSVGESAGTRDSSPWHLLHVRWADGIHSSSMLWLKHGREKAPVETGIHSIPLAVTGPEGQIRQGIWLFPGDLLESSGI